MNKVPLYNNDIFSYCVISRGAEDSSSHTFTAKLGGCFRSEPETRAEFMAMIRP